MFGIAILVFSLTLGVILRLPSLVLTRKKRAAAEARRLLFEEDVRFSIQEHDRRFPDSDNYDENGIPFL